MNKLILAFFLVISFGLQARQIKVCKSCQLKTIQAAIDLAMDGDEIIIHSGVYKENNVSILGKSIKLTGKNYPVIDGEFKETVIKVQADSVEISGLEIINVGQSYTKDFAGILLHKCKYFTICNNKLDNVFFGILVEKSHYGQIFNNTVSSQAKEEAGSGNGVHVWHCSNLKIFQNQLFGLRDGLYFEFASESEIYNNQSHNNIRYGLHFMFSNHNEYHHNEFSENGAGVAVMFSKFINMHHNHFINSWGSASYGLLLKEIYDATIAFNLFEKNTIGINGDGCNRITYSNNVFSRNGWAVKILGACYDNSFTKNDFVHNAFDLSYDGKVNDNSFEGNYWSEYTGYDLNKDGVGDVPYRPVKLFSYVVNKSPEAIVLLRSLFVDIINFSEKVSPVFTPDDLMDGKPVMHRIND